MIVSKETLRLKLPRFQFFAPHYPRASSSRELRRADRANVLFHFFSSPPLSRDIFSFFFSFFFTAKTTRTSSSLTTLGEEDDVAQRY